MGPATTAQMHQVRQLPLPPPVSIMQTSPANQGYQPDGYHNTKQLPLSLILLITSFLDSVGDIARVTRSSRLLCRHPMLRLSSIAQDLFTTDYLHLPRLYEHVSLHSFPEIRYFDGRPEGLGAGSPFSMALDGIVSRNVGGYVRDFRLLGDFQEKEKDQYEKGRIPDNTMMLNIVVRAAIEKMDKLQTFRWELNSNPMKTVYQGLASRSSLASLTIRFPALRIPRPTALIPAIPTLKYLHLIHLDPLCYNDDPSLLLLHAKQLDTLKLEWNPRMRRERELSINLQSYFGRCMAAKYRLPLKHFAMKNLYSRKDMAMGSAVSATSLESISIINCMDSKDPLTIFADSTWMSHDDAQEDYPRFKRMRLDRIDENQRQMGNFEALEEIFIINRDPPHSAATPSTNSTSSDNSSPKTPNAAETPKLTVSIASGFLAHISSQHGKCLTKLLLSDRWCLNQDTLIKLFEECPHLEELGVAVHNDFEMLEDLMTHAPKLRALRILMHPEDPMYAAMHERDIEIHCVGIGSRTAGKECDNLRWLGIGDLYFEFGGVIQVKDPKTKGMRPLRIVKPVSWETIKHVDIFGQDTLEL